MLLSLAGCVANDDRALTLDLANAGATPLRCRLLFGHWVDRDLGELAPGQSVAIALHQAADGALYVPRDDGQRLMMVENIVCAGPGDWMASFGQVDLAPLRASRPASVTATCAAPPDGGRVRCIAAAP